MAINNHPIQAVENIAKDYSGRLENDEGTLKLIFSRFGAGENSFRSLISDLCGIGAMDSSSVAALSCGFLEGMAVSSTLDLSNNVLIRNTGEELILEISS